MPAFRVALLLMVFAAGNARAQVAGAAVLAGSVRGDSSGLAMSGVQVALPALGRLTVTDLRGEFRIDGLPAGRFGISIRRVGYAFQRDTVVLVSGETTRRQIALSRLVQLDTVSVQAAKEKFSSPKTRAVEQRRRSGVGHYVDEAELRKHDGRSLAGVILAHIPGVRIVPTGSGTYLASSRNVAGRTGRTFEARSSRGSCLLTVYLDGGVLYDGSQRAAPPPNFDRFQVQDFASVEFYGAATAPPEFRRTFSACGILLLWTREGQP